MLTVTSPVTLSFAGLPTDEERTNCSSMLRRIASNLKQRLMKRVIALPMTPDPYVRSGLNSHYFHIIGDGHQPNNRVYIPIIRIPIRGGMTIPNTRSLDPGSYMVYGCIFSIFTYMNGVQKSSFHCRIST